MERIYLYLSFCCSNSLECTSRSLGLHLVLSVASLGWKKKQDGAGGVTVVSDGQVKPNESNWFSFHDGRVWYVFDSTWAPARLRCHMTSIH